MKSGTITWWVSEGFFELSLHLFVRSKDSLANFVRVILTSEVDENAQFAIVGNKPKVSTKEIAKSFKIGLSSFFRHLKKLVFKKNGRCWNIERCHFTPTTTQDRMLQNGACRIWNGKPPAPTNQPYSPDIVHSDFHLFLSVTNNLNDRRNWLSKANCLTSFYENGMKKHQERCETVVFNFLM